ncbi:RAS guanyl-releasing protein 2-like [Caloenas nicobarica]|uniref:RAS guanyl-releasing protein 2-like n=1 Tax=Caloenas nicobarica TaxID=187106 RepID=UPI0032B85DB5
MSCTLDLDRAPTLDELLRGCVEAFDAQGKVHDPHLVRLFLMLHPWYLPPPELARRLLHMLEDSGGSAEGPALRLKIRHLVCYWVRAFPEELEGDLEFLQRLRELGGALEGPGGDPEIFTDLERLLQPGGGQQEPPKSVRPPVSACPPESVPPTVCPPRHKAALLLERVEPPALAQLLTALERRVLGALQDFRSFARCGSAARSPALQGAVALSNRVARWVQLLVLTPPTPAQRARVVERFLRTAQSLLELRNFNSLLSVVGGLGHGAVTRLRRTVALLPPDIAQLWSRLADTMSAGGNYRRYRALLGAVPGAGGPGGGGAGGGFPLPALGIHLRDLVALEEALPDWAGPERPHAAKLQQRFAILGGLLGGGGPPVSADPDLLNLLTVSLELSVSEQQLYQLSLQREPRTGPPGGVTPRVCKWVRECTCDPPSVQMGGAPPGAAPPRPLGPARPPPARPGDASGAPGAAGGDPVPPVRRGRGRADLPGRVRDRARELPTAAAVRGRGHGRGRQPEPGGAPGLFPALQPRGGQDPRGTPPPFRGEQHPAPRPLRTVWGPDFGVHQPRAAVPCLRPAVPPALPGAAAPPVSPSHPKRHRDPPECHRDPPGPPRGRSLSLAMPWPRRAPPRPPPEAPPELQELEDGVFDTHL